MFYILAGFPSAEQRLSIDNLGASMRHIFLCQIYDYRFPTDQPEQCNKCHSVDYHITLTMLGLVTHEVQEYQEDSNIRLHPSLQNE